MEKIFAEAMKESLLAMKEEIIATLISENEDFKDLVEDMVQQIKTALDRAVRATSS